jgi:hypothetical protein
MAHPEFGFIFLIGILVVFSLLFPWRRASDYDINKIKDGDTKDQVMAAFGKPHDITKCGSGPAENWTYTIPFSLYVSIDFGADGRVSRRYRSGAA